MKVIIISDTHDDRRNIEKLVKIAEAEGMHKIVHCGDLHNHIDAFKGFDLDAVYWEQASGGMERYNFSRAMREINASMHENGSVFSLDDLSVFIQHNLAGYDPILSDNAFDDARSSLARKKGDKLVLFGHTHSFYYEKKDGVLVMNPGSLMNEAFVLFDTETKDVEFRSVYGQSYTIKADQDEFKRIRNLYIGKNKTYFIGQLQDENEVIVMNDKRSLGHKQILKVECFNDNAEVYTAMQDSGKHVIVCNGKVSDEHKEITKILTKYEEGDMVGIDGYVAKTDHDTEVAVIGLDEKVVGEYKAIYDFKIKEGNVFITARDSDNKSVISFNGVESKRYDSASGPEALDGKLCFTAKEGKEMFVVFDGAEQARYRCESYNDSIRNVSVVDGKLAYVVEQENKDASGKKYTDVYLIVDGREVQHMTKTDYYDGISSISEVDGKLAYLVKDSQGQSRIMLDGQVFAEHKKIECFFVIAGKEIAYKQNGCGNFVFKGREVDGGVAEITEAYQKGEL